MLSSPLRQATSHPNKSFSAFGDELKQANKENTRNESETIVDDQITAGPLSIFPENTRNESETIVDDQITTGPLSIFPENTRNESETIVDDQITAGPLSIFVL